MIGNGGKALRELASLDDESGEGKAISEERTKIFKGHYLRTLKPTRGADTFVEWLVQSPLAVVIATSVKEDEVKRVARDLRRATRPSWTMRGGPSLTRISSWLL